MPMERAPQGPITGAVIAVLEAIEGVHVGDATDPDCEKPYAVVHTVSGPRYEGPMDNTEIDSRDRYQISCIADTREQADWVRDKVRAGFTREALDTQFATDSVLRRTMILILDIPRGTRRDERGLPDPVFIGVDQYLIETTPTP